MGGRHAKPEEKASALAMYAEGVFITEIAQRTGFGTTTIFRWAQEEGILKSFSERLAAGSGSRQFGREHIGKKGAFHGTKCGWVHTDSTYEYARLEQLEALTAVAKVSRCGDRIPYEFGGRERSYIPDFRIEYLDGSVIVEEVKPARWVSDPKVRSKVEAATAFYLARGIVFRVISEEDIGADNIKAAGEVLGSRLNSDHQDAYKERRRKQRAATQRAYVARRNANATPEQMAGYRAQMAAFQRKYRAARAKKSA